MTISREECVESWAANLTIEDVADVETTKSGRRKVKFNPSKAAESILSKFPIAYCIQVYPHYSEGLRIWDGQSYACGAETILRVVFDIVAGNAATKHGANVTFDLMRDKLLVLHRAGLCDGDERFPLTIYRREREVR